MTVRELADMNEERAAGLLDDILESPDMAITTDDVETAGGRSHVIALGLNA